MDEGRRGQGDPFRISRIFRYPSAGGAPRRIGLWPLVQVSIGTTYYNLSVQHTQALR